MCLCPLSMQSLLWNHFLIFSLIRRRQEFPDKLLFIAKMQIHWGPFQEWATSDGSFIMKDGTTARLQSRGLTQEMHLFLVGRVPGRALVPQQTYTPNLLLTRLVGCSGKTIPVPYLHSWINSWVWIHTHANSSCIRDNTNLVVRESLHHQNERLCCKLSCRSEAWYLCNYWLHLYLHWRLDWFTVNKWGIHTRELRKYQGKKELIQYD